jgi:pyrimidine-specific ribonucleoside hydrolase
MKVKCTLFFLFFIYLAGFSNKIKIIIDTDCGMDDYRAITLLLSRPEFEIHAIIVSEGSVLINEGASKVKSLLHDFGADTIPVITGLKTNGTPPPWRDFNKKTLWGHYHGKTDQISFDFFKYTGNEDGLFTFISLGTLTSANVLMNDYPGFFKKINRVIWYNTSVYPHEGFNYEYDKPAADNFLKETPVRVDVISNLGNRDMKFDNDFFSSLKGESSAIKHMDWVHNQKEVKKKLDEGHFLFADELIVVYLLNPELFNTTVKKPGEKIRYTRSYNAAAVKEVITDLIIGSYSKEDNIVLSVFPKNRENYTYDVRQIVDTALLRHGHDEWKACVLTDEFHGHLGVFSIIGVKMGIKAREIFNADIDKIWVESFAGFMPPYSCLNDGIQVSTGATLGQGMIKVAEEKISRPEAVFSYKNKSVKIKLKNEYLDLINRDISEGILNFGLSDDGYWKLVRQAAIKYWVEWHRDEIFEIYELEPMKQ